MWGAKVKSCQKNKYSNEVQIPEKSIEVQQQSNCTLSFPTSAYTLGQMDTFFSAKKKIYILQTFCQIRKKDKTNCHTQFHKVCVLLTLSLTKSAFF